MQKEFALQGNLQCESSTRGRSAMPKELYFKEIDNKNDTMGRSVSTRIWEKVSKESFFNFYFGKLLLEGRKFLPSSNINIAI